MPKYHNPDKPGKVFDTKEEAIREDIVYTKIGNQTPKLVETKVKVAKVKVSE